jgi:plastocyanin
MLKKLFATSGLVCLISCLLVACGAEGSSASTTGSINATGNEIHMKGTSFMPDAITIKKGQSITLIDDDPVTPHIIANGTWENGTAKPGRSPSAPEVKNMQINGNAQASIGPFPLAGTFKFYCTIHPGMNLTVVVQ